jgi:hypothetical protein
VVSSNYQPGAAIRAELVELANREFAIPSLLHLPELRLCRPKRIGRIGCSEKSTVISIRFLERTSSSQVFRVEANGQEREGHS